MTVLVRTRCPNFFKFFIPWTTWLNASRNQCQFIVNLCTRTVYRRTKFCSSCCYNSFAEFHIIKHPPISLNLNFLVSDFLCMLNKLKDIFPYSTFSTSNNNLLYSLGIIALYKPHYFFWSFIFVLKTFISLYTEITAHITREAYP